MRCDLQNGIGRGVENRSPGFEMFRSEFVENFGAAARVESDELYFRSLFDLPNELFSKGREGRKRLIENGSREFPMSGHGVLAGRA